MPVFLARSWPALVVFGVFLLGMYRFAAAEGTVAWSVPRSARPPHEEHNLALFRWGPQVVASSYHRDPHMQHHPGFLVDGRVNPGLAEKWVSHPRDRAPWTEVRWSEARTIARVVIWHAGVLESAAMTGKNYLIRCLRDSGSSPSLKITGNVDPIATHTLACERAHGIRVEWSLDGLQDGLARVYEVEVWGR